MLVKHIRTGHCTVSECAEGVSLDKQLKICNVWDGPASYQLREWSHMAASSRHIFLGNADGVVKMFARAAPQQTPVTVLEEDDGHGNHGIVYAVSHLALSRDQRHLLILKQHKQVYTYDLELGVLDKLTPILAQIPLNPLAYLMSRKHATGCWAPNNAAVLIVYNSQPLLYRVETRVWADILLDKSAVEGSIVILPLCAWSPRGDTFVLAGSGQVFCVWLYLYNAATHRRQLTILFATKRQAVITALDFSSDGSLLVVATRLYPFIHFFSPATGDFLFSLEFAVPKTTPATARWDWVTHVQMSVVSEETQIHVAYKKNYFIHHLMPRWKATMLQVMLLKRQNRGRRFLPPELWHMISWDFRDALLLPTHRTAISPVIIHNSTFF